MDIYQKLKSDFKNIIEKNNYQDENVHVDIRSLSPQESIGDPTRKDFPLLTGKEAMVEASFKGSKGQAFTLSRSTYTGSLADILKLDLSDDYNKAIFISSLNAVLKHLKLIENTVHCKNEEPEECAGHMAKYFLENFSDKRVLLIGYQPAILENLMTSGINMRILDLNPQNIGEFRYGIKIEDGIFDFKDASNWAEILLVTGSTLANGTILNFLKLEKSGKTVIFYGNTIAGAAYLLNLPRLCFKAS